MISLGFCLDNNALFVPGAILTSPPSIEVLPVKNGITATAFTLHFYSQGAVVLPTSATVPPNLANNPIYAAAQAQVALAASLVLGIKLQDQFDAAYLAQCAFTLTGPSTNTWAGSLSTDTPACNAALGTGSGGSGGVELAALVVMGEVTLWDASGNNIGASDTFPVNLQNNVNKGTESVPVAPNASFRMKAETDGTVNLQFYNAVTQLWHSLFPYGPAAAIQTMWGVGEP